MPRLILLVIALGIAACSGSRTMPVQTIVEPAVSYDGLVPTDSAIFGSAWVDADVDFSRYNKMMLDDAEFEFRAVGKTAGSASSAPGNEAAYWISDAVKQQLIDTVTEVFGEELARSQYWEIVDTPGPDTLLLSGKLLDIVSRVPPEKVGMDDVYLDSVGEATLVLEVRDSLSGEAIFRGVDRSRIEARELARSTTVTTWTEVRRWARRWAVLIVEGMDSIHADHEPAAPGS